MFPEKRISFDIDLPHSILLLHELFISAGYELYLVGGAVRDAYLKIQPKDFDLVTNALPDVVEELIINIGFTSIATGKAFGVINVFTPDGEYEIATMRKESYDADVSVRRPTSVEFTDISTDIFRRDLIINALYYDISKNEIVDLVDGINDLENSIIRTVGNADDRFKEDKLRKIRAVRFAARFNSDLSDDIITSFLNDSSLLGISSERIHDEFIKGIKFIYKFY